MASADEGGQGKEAEFVLRGYVGVESAGGIIYVVLVQWDRPARSRVAWRISAI